MLILDLLKSISLFKESEKPIDINDRVPLFLAQHKNSEKNMRRAFIKRCGGIRQFKKIRRLHRIQNSSKEMIQNV